MHENDQRIVLRFIGSLQYGGEFAMVTIDSDVLALGETAACGASNHTHSQHCG